MDEDLEGGGRQGRVGTIGGGRLNQAGDNDSSATNAEAATVAGGNGNFAGASAATVGGGQNNGATGLGSVIAGGIGNSAFGSGAVVGGGTSNGATGSHATIPGGQGNIALGDWSFLAGRDVRNADETHDGVFMFGDSTPDTNFNSQAANEFAVRASGGYRLFSSPDTTGPNAPGLVKVTLPAGARSGSLGLLAPVPGGTSHRRDISRSEL